MAFYFMFEADSMLWKQKHIYNHAWDLCTLTIAEGCIDFLQFDFYIFIFHFLFETVTFNLHRFGLIL